MFSKTWLKAGAFLSLVFLLQACASGPGQSGVTDRRTLGVQIDDKTVISKVEDAIEQNRNLYSRTNINVNSYNGLLLLTGQAPSQDLVELATQVAQNVHGVRDVQNQIRIGNPITFTTTSRDSWITTRVKSLLIADKQVSALNIKVVTENGEVFLMGIVNQFEADRAVEIARHVNGVSRVVKVFETR